MLAVSWLVPLLFWNQKIGRCWNDNSKSSVCLICSAILPIGRKFAQHHIGHQIHMPAVLLLELTSNQRIVAEARDFVGVSDWINIHAVLGQRFGDATLKRVPKQRTRSDENHLPRLRELLAQFNQLIFNLMRKSKFTARHSRARLRILSGSASANLFQNLRHHFPLRLRPLRPFAVQTHAHLPASMPPPPMTSMVCTLAFS